MKHLDISGTLSIVKPLFSVILQLFSLSKQTQLPMFALPVRLKQVKLESRFASVVMAIAVLEGVGRSLDPHCNILEASLPVVLKASTVMKDRQ